MAEAFVMTTTELWVGDRRTLWVVLADTSDLALEPAPMAAMLTGSSERCPRRQLSALGYSLVRKCFSDGRRITPRTDLTMPVYRSCGHRGL